MFDYVVLAHCLWYIASEEMLTAVLEKARSLGKTLLIAEWDPRVHLPAQIPHYTAVHIQAIGESFKPSGFSNVRTLFYPNDIIHAISKAGWKAENSGTLFSPEMQDGLWEVNAVLDIYTEHIESIPSLPVNLKRLLFAQLHTLREYQKKTATEAAPLSVFWLTAGHSAK